MNTHVNNLAQSVAWDHKRTIQRQWRRPTALGYAVFLGLLGGVLLAVIWIAK